MTISSNLKGIVRVTRMDRALNKGWILRPLGIPLIVQYSLAVLPFVDNPPSVVLPLVRGHLIFWLESMWGVCHQATPQLRGHYVPRNVTK